MKDSQEGLKDAELGYEGRGEMTKQGNRVRGKRVKVTLGKLRKDSVWER